MTDTKKEATQEQQPERVPMTYKVSKLILHPSRKINLGNYNSAELNAGIEIVFDTPVELGSAELKQAFADGRRIVSREMREQYAPYVKKGEKK